MYKPTLTPDEAERIVSIVERILTSRKLSYGYRLSELQGYSRIDVAHALMINIAQVYKDGRGHPDFATEIPKLVNAMDSSLVHIATGGIPDNELATLASNYRLSDLIELAGEWSLMPMPGYENSNPSLLLEQRAFGNLEMPSSIAQYCSQVLKTIDTDYWEKVYAHIGLEYPKWYWAPARSSKPDKIIKTNSINEQAIENFGIMNPVVISFYLIATICWSAVTLSLFFNPKENESNFSLGMSSIFILISILITWLIREKNYILLAPVGLLGWIVESTSTIALILPVASILLWFTVLIVKWDRHQNEWQHLEWDG